MIYTSNMKTKRRAFTIVELLIVIVVIAILATVVVVSYRGAQARAIETTMQSDLTTASQTLENDLRINNSYPTTAAAANGGAGLKTSGANVISYLTKPYGYCVSVTNPASTKTYNYRSNSKVIGEGSCEVMVSSFAGNGSYGFLDGPANNAQFYYPVGIALDNSGTVYIADQNNNRIRKITSDGVVSTFCGSGTSGSADGACATAQFNQPKDIDIGTDGTMYVADTYNHRVRKITAAGVVSTLAGGSEGYLNGIGTAARFDYPYGLTVDENNFVYVADTYNHRIRKITSSGVVTTFAGSTLGNVNGLGAAAQFKFPQGLDTDSVGNLFVADSDNHSIRKITPAGAVSTLAGSGSSGYSDGSGATAQFYYPNSLSIDNGDNIVISDSSNNRIRLITKSGEVSTLAGNGGYSYIDGAGVNAQFSSPIGVEFDKNGAVFVVDTNNNRIRKITL